MNANPFGSIFVALFVALFGTASIASVGETVRWQSWDATSATGTLGEITISAATNAEAAFVGFANNHFAVFDGDCGEWDGTMGMGLSHDDMGLVTSYVNGGDSQEFTFSSPLTDGFFFLENFDSGSKAMMTVTGATSITVLDKSKNFSYEVVGENMVNLSTSNTGYDGEGDAKFLLGGDVTAVSIDFKAGEGANGILYTFAKQMEPNPVPEPTSLVGLIFGLVAVAAVRRKQA